MFRIDRVETPARSARSRWERRSSARSSEQRTFPTVGESSGVEKAGEDDTVRVTVNYKKIADADREALQQFASDMAFLKTQLPGQ